MPEPVKLSTPLKEEDIVRLRAGDRVLLSGTIYTGRDAAHQRMFDLLHSGAELPVDLRGQVIYYVGPTPTKPGRVIGSAGPTTSGRMDACAPLLLACGLKGMIGKGQRSQPVKDAIGEHKALYFGATGGAAALLARRIKSCEIVAYEDLGPEAIRRLVVKDLPVIVINDCMGGDLYSEGGKAYER